MLLNNNLQIFADFLLEMLNVVGDIKVHCIKPKALQK